MGSTGQIEQPVKLTLEESRRHKALTGFMFAQSFCIIFNEYFPNKAFMKRFGNNERLRREEREG